LIGDHCEQAEVRKAGTPIMVDQDIGLKIE